MIWSKANADDDLTRSTTNHSTVHSIASERLVPPTPSTHGNNIFSRAYNSLFGSSDNGPNNVTETPRTTYSDHQVTDYSEPLNQSMRTFDNYLSETTNKRVNWGGYETKDRTLDDYIDSDEEVNETVHSIRNLRNNNIPGTYPDSFPTPYIPRNYKIDEESLDNRKILQNYLDQVNETNRFLEELLSIQQYERVNQKDQTAAFVKLKREYAKELQDSKQVYEGFRKLLFKYKSLKEQFKSSGAANLDSTNDKDIRVQLQATKNSLMTKTRRIEELERDLKKLTDQRDDLKTTILDFKNQNLRLKTSNEMLTAQNASLSKKIDQSRSTSILEKKNEMLELQITRTNEMFKAQTDKLKEQIFDLEADAKKQRELHDYEIYSKNKRIEELEKLLSFKSPAIDDFDSPFITKPKKTRPASYHEPSTRISSPIRLDRNIDRPKSSYRSQVLNQIDENSINYQRAAKSRSGPHSSFKTKSFDNDLSISDISAILNNNQSEDLTGFDNDRVTNRLLRKAKNDNHDLSAIFSHPRH